MFTTKSLCTLLFCSLPYLSVVAEEAKVDAGPAPTPEATKSVEELSKRGALVTPLASSLNWYYANFRGVAQLEAADFTHLKAITGLVELDLAGKQFSEADLANIAGLKDIKKLNLSKTNITDAGLAAVKDLVNLESLNLYGTAITDAGLANVSGLKNLKRIYLFDSKVTDGAVENLWNTIPGIRVERGWDKPSTPPPPPAPTAPAPAAPAPAAPAPVPTP